MLTFIDRFGQTVRKGDRLTSYADRGVEAKCLGFSNQKWITIEIAGEHPLNCLDAGEFKRSSWVRTPNEITKFVDAKGIPIGVGDRIATESMAADVVALKGERLEIRCWYTNASCDPNRHYTVTDLAWAEILHAGWTKQEPQILFHHDRCPLLAVHVRNLKQGAFFVLNDELHQVKSHNSTGWANCHNLNKATHPSVDWSCTVTPVQVRIETKNL